MELFFSHVHLHGGPASVRRLPDLIDRIWTRQIEPGKMFDLELPLDESRPWIPGHGPPRGHQGPPASLTERRDVTGADRGDCHRANLDASEHALVTWW
jgi:hypothetical protein